MAPSSAQAFAESVGTFTPTDWWRLELSALNMAGTENVRMAVARKAPASIPVEELLPQNSGGCLSSAVFMLALFVPLVLTPMLFFFGSTAFRDALLAFGIAAAVALVIVVVTQIRSAIKGQRTVRTVAALTVLVVGLPAALSAWIISARVGAGDAPGALLWTMLPFVAFAAFCVVWLFIAAPNRPRPTSLTQYIRDEVRALPNATTLAIHADLAQAIDTLIAREVVAADRGAIAKRMPLGELGSTMAPELARTDDAMGRRRQF